MASSSIDYQIFSPSTLVTEKALLQLSGTRFLLLLMVGNKGDYTDLAFIPWTESSEELSMEYLENLARTKIQMSANRTILG